MSDQKSGACPDTSGLDAKELDLAVGGQAVIEGVMMRSPNAIATAVRTPDGRIVVRKKPFRSVFKKLKFLNIPVVRGGIHLIESMGLGIDALMFSADQAVEEDRVEKKEKTLGDTLMMWGTVVFAFIMSMGLFFYLPLLVTDWLGVDDPFWFNVVDGIIRIVFFVAYLKIISLMKDMARVFQYHGSEHMSIHCFENGLDLTVANTRPFTTLHPRCGTSFLFFVMLIALVVFSLMGKPDNVVERLQRIAFIPVIGGLAYEAIKLSGKFKDSWLIKPLIWPGLMLQKITTSRPDDDQIEVALAALRAVLTPEADDFPERTYYEFPATDAPSPAAVEA
ncbi:MAG TPA: DUF1385 domain-containing protein [Candidatus Krumholzibacteria bacterium]|nr:DUF1385 domain-containing protein [Candidatus Krumholzibacteria bacterium]HRX50785.1 DUF1385 domain-containing protein [Candidatus Krumholzibacteria bacterium]